MLARRKQNVDVIFSTREFALSHALSLSAASHHLKVLARRGEVARITRGIWARPEHPHFSPLACVPWLLGKERGYVSFLTALHRHGAISQIPGTIQVATTGHTRKLNTPIGHFEFIQMKPEMMREGVEWSETHVPFQLATLEKSLLDVIYRGTRKGRRFASLPELHRVFDGKKVRTLLRGQRFPLPVRRAIEMKLSQLQKGKTKT